VVDGYPPIVAGLKRDIDQIEASVFSGAFKRNLRDLEVGRVC
jgi:hypothetical protein